MAQCRAYELISLHSGSAHVTANFQATLCGTPEGQRDIASGLSPSISLFSCQYHSLNAASYFSFAKHRI